MFKPSTPAREPSRLLRMPDNFDSNQDMVTIRGKETTVFIVQQRKVESKSDRQVKKEAENEKTEGQKNTKRAIIKK